MAPTPGVLDALNFDIHIRGRVLITAESSAVDRTLSATDYETFLDAFMDALDMQGVQNLTVGATLTLGEMETSFTIDAPNPFAAQQAAETVVLIADRAATRSMDTVLAGGREVMVDWLSSSADPALINA